MEADSSRLRVLIVDDSAQIRKALSSIVSEELSPVEVVLAENGVVALEKAAKSNFDLVLLDLSMPEMDGYTFLRLFRARSQTPVLVISSLNELLYIERALEMGANAFLAKPSDFFANRVSIREEFRLKLKKLLPKNILKGRTPPKSPFIEDQTPPPLPRRSYPKGFPVVAIGCSSGGPPTLQYLLSGIPTEICAAIIIAQHMPKGFTTGMVERLKRLMPVNMREAVDGEVVKPGVVYFCPGGINMRVSAEGGMAVLHAERPKEREISPNVDILFESAALAFGERLTGIVLTGMGRDGSEGVKKIKACGGTVLAESDETAAIYGMPKEAAATGCVDTVLALPEISNALIRIVTKD